MKFKYGPKSAAVLFIIIAVLFIPAVQALALTAGEITRGFTCPCGCNMLVSACECDTAKKITARVAQMIEKGQSKEEIIQSFVNTHGEKILAAPTKKGFNLTAWILPFLAIILRAGGIYIFIDKCLISRKATSDKSEYDNKTQAVEAKYLDLVEKELKDFEL